MPNLVFNKTFRGRFIVLILVILSVIAYQHMTRKTIEKKPGTVYMLQWTGANTEPFSYMSTGTHAFEERKCPVIACYVTENRYILGNIKKFDALLFHEKEFIEQRTSQKPQERNHQQIYVFASMESSRYYPVPKTIYDSYFNLTWTYKLDSDIYFGYIVIRNNTGEIIGPTKEMHWMSRSEMLPVNEAIKNKISAKSKAAAWFSSNCLSLSHREEVVSEIRKEMDRYGMTLDVYGRCGDKSCPRSAMGHCLKLIEKDYYFYFSFENSLAEDYVTEKLLTALNNYAVPVVFGGANYSRFMPDGIYLDAEKLGPKRLVREMFKLIQELDSYYEYFKWHNHYTYHSPSESPDTDPYCQLCKYLSDMKINNKSQVKHYLSTWWNPL